MVLLSPIRLGAPGIYPYPEVPLRALSGVRMDVCAFVGVAPRGPARVPVVNEKWLDDRPCVEPERPRSRTVAQAVESFDEYRNLYGAFEGPGLLPYAVAAFFEQGGRRAYIARIVPDYNDPPANSGGVAKGNVPGVQTTAGPLLLCARNEGRWGNRLRASLEFSVRPLSFERSTATGLTLGADVDLPSGALLRITLPSGARILRFIANVIEEGRAETAGTILQATFDQPSGAIPEAVEVVEGRLHLDDGEGRAERHERLGLSSLHPRWMATVLCYESQLIFPDSTWIDADILPDNPDLVVDTPPTLPLCEDGTPSQFCDGEDRYADITPEDFFDSSWTLGDDEPGSGIHALTQLSDLSLLVVPDLYSPGPLTPTESIFDPISLAGPDFERCVDVLPKNPMQGKNSVSDLEGLRLDPRLPDDLLRIAGLQTDLVKFAEQMSSFVALLDVPPGLNQRKILAWRAPFSSSYAAAYHPWLTVARRDDQRDTLIRVPPSAVAAGIIARQELASGVQHGPANVIAAEIVSLDDAVSPARHDELHQLGINVYLRERDGIRLTAARTLSRDPAYRQLSVRRLMVMLRRTLEQKTQWIVFEPNNSSLRSEVRHLLAGYLRQLFQAGAFRGATEEEAFFVRCDETLNPQRIIDAGQLITEVGVAPAEPLEFIVLRLSHDGDGTLTVKE
ncbi:MAG: phage tail sheath family protein [Pyrinomonadaceae bacterium]|nr:phage tail sheath family protein [Pyrinomonadaceae bacterium]